MMFDLALAKCTVYMWLPVSIILTPILAVLCYESALGSEMVTTSRKGADFVVYTKSGLKFSPILLFPDF